MTTLLTVYIKCGVDRDRPSLDYAGTQFFNELEATQSQITPG